MARWRRRYPQTQVVMLTVYASEDKVFESLRNGACGDVLKKTPPSELMEAVRDAHQGGSPMSSEIARKVIDERPADKLAVSLEQSASSQETHAHALPGAGAGA